MNHLAVVALALLTLGSFAVEAQRARKKSTPPAPPARTPRRAAPRAAAPRSERVVPFKIGETLTYDVSWSSFLTAGTAVTTVKEKKPSFDSTAYYIVAEGRPTPLVAKLYSVYYKLDTLLDSYTLLPQRGTVYSEERGKRRFKVSRFDHAARRVAFEYESTNKASDNFPIPPYTQDVLSAIYVLRADSAEGRRRHDDAGDRRRFELQAAGQCRSGRAGENAAERSERVAVEAHDLRPHRPSPGRNVAMWLSEDPRRLPMKFQAELPIGTFNLDLREVR